MDTALATLLITTIIVGIFTIGLLRRSGWDATSLVTAGDHFCDPAAVPGNLSIYRDNGGYDGQFYFRLALDPFTSTRTDFGITLDVPSYRQQRILYPLLAWAISAGRADLAPWAMLLINCAALCSLGWLGGAYAQTLKQHALWGLFLPLYPASLFSLTRDLVELLEVSLVVGSLLLLRRSKPLWGAVLLALSVLAKETALLVPGAAMLGYLFDLRQGRPARFPWYYFALPIVIFLIWQLALRANWGVFPSMSGKSSIMAIPFSGFLGLLRDTSSLQTPLQRRIFPELIMLSIFAFSVIYHLRTTAAAAHEICSWFLYLALALSLGRVVWIDDWAYLRALSEFSVLGIIILIGSSPRVAKALALGNFAILWLYLFIRLLRHGD